MPMANIFKLSPGTQSFFTILLLLYVVLHLVLPRKATLLVILFAVYVVVGELFAGQFNLFRTIKLVCNILFISSILNSEVKIRQKEIFLSFIIGNIIASIFGLMDSNVFKIVDYIGLLEFKNAALGIDVFRFAGLYADPNYYAVSMIISICLLIILYYQGEIKPLFMGLLVAPIIYFLILTYSKSAILMAFVAFLFLLYALFKKKKYVTVLAFIILMVSVVVLALSGAISVLEVVVSRFSLADKGTEIDVNALTTGRFDLWISYVKYILFNIKTLFFGDSISAGLLNESASHNTYLDIIYHLGLVGGILLVVSLKTILSQSACVVAKRNFLNYSVFICVIAMYFFLGELFYFDPPFHIFLAFSVLNLPLDETSLKNIRRTLNETSKHKIDYMGS